MKVDILLRRVDLEAARRALESAGFVYRRVSILGQPGALDLFLDGPNAGARDAVHVLFAQERIRPDSPVKQEKLLRRCLVPDRQSILMTDSNMKVLRADTDLPADSAQVPLEIRRMFHNADQV